MGMRVHSLNERQEQGEDITLYEHAGIMALARHVFDENRVAGSRSVMAYTSERVEIE